MDVGSCMARSSGGTRLGVMVGQFGLVGMSITPDEADAVLLVYADAVLARAVAAQYFEAVAGGRAEVLYARRGVQHSELTTGAPDDVSGKSTRRTNSGIGGRRSGGVTLEKRLGVGITE